MIRFIASPDEVGERIDAIVARRAGVARSRAQQALRDGTVTVSGAAVRPSHRLAAGDVVEGNVAAPEPAPPAAEDIPIDIRYSDERVLVVSKPAGLVAHPAGGHDTGTLVNALLGLGEPLSRHDPERPGIVHRLDKDTSGLLLVAKDEDAHRLLTGALKRRAIERRYLAMVRGTPPAASGTIDAPIGRHPTRRRLMAVTAAGRPAVTHYRIVERSEALSLLEVTLETGRTHQIRVHLAHVGHPVLGDRTYGGASELSRGVGLDRPFLHAYRLTFPHPSDGHEVSVTDELPPDLTAALARAGLAAST